MRDELHALHGAAYGVEVAQNSATGLRMASVFSSAQPDSQSFIRLYNPTSAAGTVNVTLADYATGNLLGVVLCDGDIDTHRALEVAERIRHALTGRAMIHGIEIEPSVSIGVAVASAGIVRRKLARTPSTSIPERRPTTTDAGPMAVRKVTACAASRSTSAR